MKNLTLMMALTGLLVGCASPVYLVDNNGPLASVTYVRTEVNHYISEQTGEVVPSDQVATFSGRMITTEHRKTYPTTLYLYDTVDCSDSPTVMGSIDYDDPNARRVTLQVAAGVPLVNSYRTQFKTCERDCYKRFYVSSMFVPQANARYEVVVEPIDGVTVYQWVGDEKQPVAVETNLPKACQY